MKKLLLLACVCLAALSMTAEEYTVYLKNTANWAKPTCWAWSTSMNCTAKGTWPGDDMVKEGDLWKFTAPEGKVPEFVIFSNSGSTQTGNLKFRNGATYDCSGTVIEGGDDPIVPVTPPQGGVFKPGKYLTNDYYKVNPDGKVGSNRTVAVKSGENTDAPSHWTEDDLIAQGVARDVCMSIRGLHERPVIDTYAVYAAYDKNNLYVGVQYVYAVYDQYGEGYQAKESKPYKIDGKIMLAFDIDPNKACDGTLVNGASVWFDKAYTTFDNGMDCIFLGSTKPGVGTPGLFVPNANGKFDYNDPASCKSHGITYGYGDGLVSGITQIWGPEEFRFDPATLESGEGFADLLPQLVKFGGKDTDHTVYEFKIPLADLSITEEYIKTYGIGLMVVDIYGSSAHSCTPYDPSTFDNVDKPYSQDKSTSMEKEDLDVITYGFARIGKLAGEPAGIEDVVDDSANAPVEYYNLQGVRVSNPQGGIFIKRQGKNVTKVIM